MSQKAVLVSNSNATDRLQSLMQGSDWLHLSDGTLVFLVYDPSTSLFVLSYTTDRVTINTIDTQTSAGAICRDSSDNIYFVSANTIAYKKGAGYTWTRMAGSSGFVAYAATTSYPFSAVWCNTGGGVGGAGHIMSIGVSGASTPTWNVYDAGKLLAGTAGAGTGGAGNDVVTGSTSQGSLKKLLQLSSNGFGATSGICLVYPGGATSMHFASWSISNTGALTQVNNTAITTGAASSLLATGHKVCAVWMSNNLWAFVSIGAVAGSWNIFRLSSSAVIGTYTSVGSPANMPLTSDTYGWCVFKDPLTPNQIWIMAAATPFSGTQIVWRLPISGLDVGVTVGSAVQDDTLTNTAATDGNPDMTAVLNPISSARIDWGLNVEPATTPTYAFDTDYTVFNTSPNCAWDANSRADGSVVNQPPNLAFDVTDSDPSQTDTLTIQASQDPTFASGVQTFSASSATPTNNAVLSSTPPNNLAPGTWYVRAHAVDTPGGDSGYTASRSFNLQPIC